MKPIRYFLSFQHLQISEPVAGFIELMPFVHITNDRTLIADWLDAECYMAIGAIEAAHLE